MNIDKLYTTVSACHATGAEAQKLCKLCLKDLTRDEHDSDCPGVVLDKLVYEIHVHGPNCGRSCCGYADMALPEGLMERAAARVRQQDVEEQYGPWLTTRS